MSKNLTDTAPRASDAELDALARQNTGVGDDFVSGLRSGLHGAVSQLDALAGGVGEALGANEFAQGRYKAAQEAAQEAATFAPSVASYRDVHGVRDALKYGAGLMGQMTPVGAAAVGGALLGGPVGAGAVMAPLEVGDIINRQQAAPGGPQGTPGERLAQAGLGGVGSAALQAVVPASVAGKIAGKAGGGLLGLGREVLTGGVTGVGSEALKQQVVGENNPDAIKEAGVAGAVGGLGMGLPGVLAEGGHAPVQGARKLIGQGVQKVGEVTQPVVQASYDLGGQAVQKGKELAGQGAELAGQMADKGKALFGRGKEVAADAGDAARNLTDSAMASAKELPGQVAEASRALVGRAKEAGEMAPWAIDAAATRGKNALKERGIDLGDVADKAIDGLASLGRSGTEALGRVARGESFALPKAFEGLNGDALKQAVAEDGRRAVELARQYGTELYQKATSPELREQLGAALSNLNDGANRAFIASQQLAADTAKAAQVKVENLAQSFRQSEMGKAVSGMFKKSDDREGVRKVVGEAIAPYLQQHAPELLQGGNLVKVGDSLRGALGEMMSGKPLGFDQTLSLIETFGGHTANILDRVRRAMKIDDPAQLDKFFASAQQLREAQQAHAGLLETMRQNLAAGPDSASTAELEQAARGLVQWASTHGAQSDRGANLAAKFHDERVRQGLQQYFGKGTDKVLAAAEKMIPREENQVEKARVKYDEDGNPIGQHDGDTPAGVDAPSTRLQVFGKLNLHPDEDPGKAGFESAGKQAMTKAQAGNPNRTVRWASAEEIGMDHPAVKQQYDYLVKKDLDAGLSLEEAQRYADEEIGKYGAPAAEVSNDKTVVSGDELKGMRLDTHDYGRSASRIDFGQAGVKALDARKIVREMGRRFEGEPLSVTGDIGKPQRLARLFMEGLAALQDYAGKPIEVPDSVVVGRSGGKDWTWGELKKLDTRTDSDKASDADTQRLVQLRKEFKQAPAQDRREMAREGKKLVGRKEDQVAREQTWMDEPQVTDDSLAASGREERDPFGPTHDALQGAGEGAPIHTDSGEARVEGVGAPSLLGGKRQERAPLPEPKPDSQELTRQQQERQTAQRAAVDRMAASEDYSRITPEKADNFLKAAKARYDELLAARQKLEDADMELPQDKARVLNNLMQLFGEDSHADLGSFYDGAKTDAEVRAMLEGSQRVAGALANRVTARWPVSSPAVMMVLNDAVSKLNDLSPGAHVDEALSELRRLQKSDLPELAADAKKGEALLKNTIEQLKSRREDKANGPVKELMNSGGLDSLPKSGSVVDAILGVRTARGPKPKKLSEVMDTIITHSEDESARAVAKAIRKVAGDADVRVGEPRGGAFGMYFPDDHSIRVSERALNANLGVSTLLHEGIHAATVRALHDDAGLHRALYALLDHVAKHDADTAQAYGASSTLEFLAEGLSNPAFQERLKQIPANKEVGGFIQARVASAWDSFVTLVRKALGLDPKHESALSQLIDLGGLSMKGAAGVDGREYGLRKLSGRPMTTPEKIIGEAKLDLKTPELQKAYDDALEQVAGIGTHNNRAAAQWFKHQVDGAQKYFSPEQLVDDIPKYARMAGDMVAQFAGLPSEVRGMSEGTPDPKAVAAKKAAFLEKAASGDKALAQEVRTTDDAKGLQRAITAMAQRKVDGPVMEAAQARMRELVADPDTAYSLLTKKYTAERAAASGPVDFADAFAHIGKVLGNDVRIELNKQMPHAGEFERVLKQQGGVEDVIRLSVHALNPASAAYHESLHAFFARLTDQGNGEIAGILEKAAASPVVMAQLRKLLAGSPEALAQLSDREERAAYAYQFWAQGKLKLAQEPTTLFGRIKDMVLKTLGIWSNDERALHILEYFHSGEFAKPGLRGEEVQRALMEPGRNRAIENIKAMAQPLLNLGEKLAVAGHQRLRDTDIPALTELADKMKLGTNSEGSDAGFIPAARSERSRRMNALGTALHGIGMDDLRVALDMLQGRVVAGASKDARRAVVTVRKVLGDSLKYMQDAGVNVQDLGPDYFPRVWDTNFITGHQKEFLEMLGKYKQDVSDPQGLMNHLLANDGNEFAVTSRPGMQFAKQRVLSFIKPEDAERFLNKNLYETLNSYLTQATRRAEWARRFGDDGAGLERLLESAKEQGATTEQLDTARKYVQAVDGTLGDDVNPEWRRLQGNLMVYQNIRLLPLAIFSSAVDPMGIMVRGGTMRDALGAFKRGIMNVRKGFQADPKIDAAEELAQTLGTIDSTALAHTLGTSYSQGMVSETGRKINDTFFRWNLMERFNTDMRVAATQAAVRFIGRHADGTASPHSARWIAELGLKPGDIQRNAGGDLKLTEADGLTPEHAARMRLAINRWVDGAVLRPDAADKPLWMSDPHYAIVAHLKQFTFSFQETILKRMAHEAAQGNYGPALSLASYVPIMIAADMVKGMIQGGGQQPSWKQDWGPEDYLQSGVERAGLLGVGQLALDGPGMLGGPTLQQLGDVVDTLRGREQFSSFTLHSMPANALYANWIGDSAAEARVAD